MTITPMMKRLAGLAARFRKRPRLERRVNPGNLPYAYVTKLPPDLTEAELTEGFPARRQPQ